MLSWANGLLRILVSFLTLVFPRSASHLQPFMNFMFQKHVPAIHSQTHLAAAWLGRGMKPVEVLSPVAFGAARAEKAKPINLSSCSALATRLPPVLVIRGCPRKLWGLEIVTCIHVPGTLRSFSCSSKFKSTNHRQNKNERFFFLIQVITHLFQERYLVL